MVIFDSNFRHKHRSVVRKARAEKIRCVKLESNLWYCARKAKGHGRYLIQIDETKSGLFANCRTIRGASCPTWNKCCVHIAKVYLAMIQDGRRKIREQAA